MTKRELVEFIRHHKYAVQASVSAAGGPQAAVIGIAVNDALEIVFDTLSSTRKCQNLRRDPRVALVIGWDEEQTLQIEGVADEPRGEDLTRLLELYLARFPDGRERQQWPDITYFRVRPSWARYSDFRAASAGVVEIDLSGTSSG